MVPKSNVIQCTLREVHLLSWPLFIVPCPKGNHFVCCWFILPLFSLKNMSYTHMYSCHFSHKNYYTVNKATQDASLHVATPWRRFCNSADTPLTPHWKRSITRAQHNVFSLSPTDGRLKSIFATKHFYQNRSSFLIYPSPHPHSYEEGAFCSFQQEKVTGGRVAPHDSPGHRLPLHWRDPDTAGCSLLPNWRE